MLIGCNFLRVGPFRKTSLRLRLWFGLRWDRFGRMAAMGSCARSERCLQLSAGVGPGAQS
eukprot:1322812-Alexandrium_andersonii.AAC.1